MTSMVSSAAAGSAANKPWLINAAKAKDLNDFMG
jgi:hypothetical protein